MPIGLETVKFIYKYKVPKRKFATHNLCENCVQDMPSRIEIYRKLLTGGGNLIKYLHNVITPTSDISTVNCLLNIAIYTPNAKLCWEDTKAFYLNTPMDTYEYMRIKASLIPEEIMKK